MTIETKLGTLVAQQLLFGLYPGFHIYLQRGDTRISLCLVEADQLEEEPTLKIHVWSASDMREDAPVYDQVATKDEINKAFDDIE